MAASSGPVAVLAATVVLCAVLGVHGEITVEPLRCYHCSENENCNENLGMAAPCRSVYDRCATFYDSATAACVLARGCFTYFSGCYELPSGKVVCICPEDECNSRLIVPGPNVPERNCPLNVKTRFRELHNLNKVEQPAFAFDGPAYIVPMPSGDAAAKRTKRSISPFHGARDRREMTPSEFEFRELTRIKPHMSIDPDAGMINVKNSAVPGHNLETDMGNLQDQGLVDDDPYDGYSPREALLVKDLLDKGVISLQDKHIIPEEEFDFTEYSVRKLKPIFITTHERMMQMDRTNLPIPPNFHARVNQLEEHLPEEMLREKSPNGTIYPPPESKPNFEAFAPLPTPAGFKKVGIRPLGVTSGAGGVCPCAFVAVGLFVLGFLSLIFSNLSNGQKLLQDSAAHYGYTF